MLKKMAWYSADYLKAKNNCSEREHEMLRIEGWAIFTNNWSFVITN
jgi:hypothetical protein